MRTLLTATCLTLCFSAAALAGSSWGSSGDLVPGDNGKPMIVNPWMGHHDDVIKLDDPVIVIDTGPSEEDEGIVFIGNRPAYAMTGMTALFGWEAE